MGFRDDRTANTSVAYNAGMYSRDALSSIIKKYLRPTFQCEVDLVTSSGGIVHPVVWIPSHGSVPICSKADGPADTNGRPQGIRVATYYTRAAGPESVPVTTPEQWDPIIRRCIVHERESLVGLFDSILRSPSPSVPLQERLVRWHERADRHFVEMAQAL